VLELRSTDTQCSSGVEATVISTAAYRASKAAQAPNNTALQEQAPPREPTEVEIQQEYDRLFVSAAPVKEFHVRHILVRTREDAVAVLQRIKSGKSFADIAAEVSIDPGSRSRGGDLGWNVPSSFIEEFSKTMVSLAPAGLAAEPTHTRFGWHVIEVLEAKTGKDSFPPLSAVKNRISARLKNAQGASVRVGAKAVCRKMVAPEFPAAALQDGTKGTVVAEMRVENGKIAEILSLSGPSIFYPVVIAAVNKYECDRLDRAVIATQTFDF
jgi:parvulin-like peptidyl-prolyl isomerase